MVSSTTLSVTELSQVLGEKLLARKWRVATAESCTGGGVAAAITAIAGSSAWFEYGIVSYANQAKEKLLHVDSHTLSTEGAVSPVRGRTRRTHTSNRIFVAFCLHSICQQDGMRHAIDRNDFAVGLDGPFNDFKRVIPA